MNADDFVLFDCTGCQHIPIFIPREFRVRQTICLCGTADLDMLDRRHRKITFPMQVVMWFAGLRGAIAFVLAQ